MLATAGVYAPHVARAGFVYEDTNDVDRTYPPYRGVVAEAQVFWRQPLRAWPGLVGRVVGAEPTAQHALGLALHLLCGLLVWRLAALVSGPWTALVAAGVFWLHPVQTETVAYAAANPDLWVTLCVLLGCLAVSSDRLGLAWLAAVAAVLAKESGVVAWLLLPLWAWMTGHLWSRCARALWAASIAVPACFAVTLVNGHLSGGVGSILGGGLHGSYTGLASGWRLLALVVWPVGLSIYHGVPVSVWPAALLTAVVIGACWLLRTVSDWPLFVAAWVGLAWLPRFVLPLAEGLHEHHLYLPMVGIALGLARVLCAEGRTHGYGY